ncbi:MAG: DoxX family protein [Gemmatimonadota bacterium]
METFVLIVQVIIALGIFNVWLIRPRKATAWRGGEATNLKEEFETYGLPGWAMGVVGFLKLLFAVLLLVGIWYPPVVQPAAIGMAVLMAGAVTMHVKVGDPFERSLPALTVLVLSLIVAFL